jgi:hypothetical protein
MQLSILYSEVNQLIASNMELPISITYGGDGMLSVMYRYKTNVFLIGEITKDISINLVIDSVTPRAVTLRTDNGGVVDAIISNVLQSFVSMKSINFIEISGPYIQVTLEKIPSLIPFLKLVNLKSITPTPSDIGISVDII